MSGITRGEVVEFIRQSAALHEPRWRGLPVFRPRADRGDALVDFLRTGVALALATPTVQLVECPACAGEGEIVEATGGGSYEAGPDYRVERCYDCRRTGQVRERRCVHGETLDQPNHDACVETWAYLAQPVGDALHGSEIACDPLAGCSAS